MDAGARRARQRTGCAAPGGRGRCRVPLLPYPHELHRALSQGHFADRRHRRPEARARQSDVARRSVSVRAQSALWLAQRASAAVLALCVVVHLATVIYAVRGGLSAAEILGRTRGSAGWAAFYSLFVLAVSIHAPIGLRAVFIEWLRWRGSSRDIFLLVFSLTLLAMGLRAVTAVFG